MKNPGSIFGGISLALLLWLSASNGEAMGVDLTNATPRLLSVSAAGSNGIPGVDLQFTYNSRGKIILGSASAVGSNLVTGTVTLLKKANGSRTYSITARGTTVKTLTLRLKGTLGSASAACVYSNGRERVSAPALAVDLSFISPVPARWRLMPEFDTKVRGKIIGSGLLSGGYGNDSPGPAVLKGKLTRTRLTWRLKQGTQILTFTGVATANTNDFLGTLIVTLPPERATYKRFLVSLWAGPSIAAQPQSRTNNLGTDATFTVTADGTDPLVYQWRFNGSILADATASSLTRSEVQAADAGFYSVLITNRFGSVTSADAILTVNVNVPPSIAAQPQSRTNNVGTDATFTVTADGAEPLAYQWRFNGTNLADATASSLTRPEVQTADAGSYSVVITNRFGSVTSADAILTVKPNLPPSIGAQPQSRTNNFGTDATFTVTADGTEPLAYQWRFNGSNLVGATGSSLTRSGVQAANAGFYSALITNRFGSVTSAVAILTVILPPSIAAQPQSRTNNVGTDASFSVTATGSAPLSYQWLKDGVVLHDGGAISGATSSSLTVSGVITNDAGGYRVVVTNVAGAATSAIASLSVSLSQPIGADATVLVNSTSSRFSDFQRWIKPYLDNFGVPYTVQDIATNAVGTNIAQTALIIIGHRQIDTNLLFLNSAAQANIASAVSNGAGLVNFDTDLFTATNHRYQFIESIFGFGYAPNFLASDVTFPQTEPGLHFITALHPTNDLITLRSATTMTGMVLPTNATAIALSGGKPFVSIRSYGQGRALQWANVDWMAVEVRGPMGGLDDLIWRGLAWTARKPFVMRLMPNFVTTRWDDCSGPFWWVHTMNEFGFKPFLAPFISDVAPADIPDLRFLCTNGMATASPHGFSGFNLIFFNYGLGTNYSDTVVSNNMYVAKQWHITNAIPMSKVIATHYSEIGTNALPWLLDWGVEYLPVEVPINTLEYSPPYAPWLVGGPYRLYETPLQGQSNLPLYYADFLAFTNQPQVDGKFFNCYSEMRDAAACGQWCPYNNVQASIVDGTAIVKRALDSKVLATLYSHEPAIQNTPSVPNNQPVTSNNWRVIVSGLVSNLAPYEPVYVTLDYASQYARATRTSRILSATLDPASGQVTANSSGVSDLAMQVQVFLDNAGSNIGTTIPPFTNANSSLLAVLPAPPLILKQPTGGANGARSNARGSVVGPLRIESVSASEGSVVISWSAIPGRTYSLQKKLEMDTDWEDILPAVTAEGPMASATNSATNPQGFYRVHLLP